MISSDPQLNFGIFTFSKDTADMFYFGLDEIGIIGTAFKLYSLPFDNGKFADNTFFSIRYRSFYNQIFLEIKKARVIKSGQGIK